MANAKKLVMKDKKVLEEKFGLFVQVDESKHLKLNVSDGRIDRQIVTSKTPGDNRGRRNHIARLRRTLKTGYGIESKTSDFRIEMFTGNHK